MVNFNPIRIDNAGQASLDRVRQVASNGSKVGAFSLNGIIYSVKIVGSQVNVTRETGGLRAIFSRNRQDIQQALESQMKELLSTQAKDYYTKLNMAAQTHATLKGDQRIAQSETQKPDSWVAGYGFTEPRLTMQESVATSQQTLFPKNTTVDAMNTAMGIVPHSFNARRLADTLTQIRDGNLAYTTIPSGELKGQDDPALCQEWKLFLSRPANVERLDIFGKMHSFLAEARSDKDIPELSSWARLVREKGEQAAVEAFIKKNLPMDFTQPIFAQYMPQDYVRTVAKAVLGYLGNHERTDATAVQEVYTQLQQQDRVLADVFDAFTITACFRQTSKMGLEFFAEQRVPVVFAWSTYRGVGMTNQDMPSTDKWWRLDGPVPQGKFEPITHSEMRYVQRMEERGDPHHVLANIVKIHGAAPDANFLKPTQGT